MIVNAYAVLILLMNVVRLPLALVVIGGGIPAIRRWRPSLPAEARGQLENRLYLLLMAAMLLGVLSVLSWPLLYWLLQSYVSEWPGVMCIYGVTRIGTGSFGASQSLPPLLAALQILKPVLVLLAGSWLVVYWLNRSTAESPLMRRVLVAMVLMGVAAAADSILETAYVLIPKQENLPTVGCCTNALAVRASRFGPSRWLPGSDPRWLVGGYYGANGLMLLGLTGWLGSRRPGARDGWLGGLLVGMLVLLFAGALFLLEIAAPAILQLPHHHCAYDLFAAAPESVLGIATFVVASMSICWACVARWLGRCEGTASASAVLADKTLFLALFGYAFSLVLFSVELALNVPG